MSATGVGSSFTSGPTGENYATPVAGKAKNYYYKLGFKPVKTTKPKSFDKKQDLIVCFKNAGVSHHHGV